MAEAYASLLAVRLDYEWDWAGVEDAFRRTVAINAIHLDRIPEFDYDLLWRERQLKSVANYTRADAAEFLTLAAEIPIRTAIEEYPLTEANTALAKLRTGETHGTAVLVP